MSRVGLITNAHEFSGVGHYAAEIHRGLKRTSQNDWQSILFRLDGTDRLVSKNGRNVAEVSPLPKPFNAKSISWIRLARALRKYIATTDKFDYQLFHITNQTLSFLAPKLTPSVITVHDIIEKIEPQDRRAKLLNSYLYRGINRASAIIALSEFTKRTVIENLGVDEQRITVIPNGVSSSFFPIENFAQTIGYQELRRELDIAGREAPIVLFVGSDHPRKNLGVALDAFAKVKERLHEAVFIKVGAPGLPVEREKNLQKIDSLGLRESVRFIHHIDNQRLNELYNLADVCIFPSKMEGFGLPPLQSMAAGTPVVAGNSSSIPEVAGGAARLQDPNNSNGFAEDIIQIFQDNQVRERLREQGLKRAQKFDWDEVIKKTTEVYDSIL